MNANIRFILATIVAAALLSGCDIYGYGLVTKSTLDEQVSLAKKSAEKERDQAKSDLKFLQDHPKETIIGLTEEACAAKIADAVSKKSCQMATPAPVKKPIVTNRPAKQVYINKHASGGKTLPNPGPVIPPTPTVPTARAPGGCIYESDGSLVLKGMNEKQRKGVEVARISDEDLKIKHQKLVASHPEGFVTDVAHFAMCKAWSALVAAEIQRPEGLRVNNDTHRTQ